MNRIFKTLVAGALALAVAAPAIAGKGKAYGKKFKTENSFSATELSRKMAEQKKMENVVISGTISEVCQAEGCWMKMKNEAGADIFVKFKDHAFLIPKDLAGHTALVNGTASKKVVTVAELKHFAEDAGKSADEIAKITEPKEELRIDATGVVIN